MTSAPHIVVIVGPTAAGKSTAALMMASELGGEIVSADSRLVYRYMDIGTAKPPAAQRAETPHHLIDVVDPDNEYSLGVYLRQARAAIGEIHARSKVPIVAGGTGQYVWALVEGWNVPEVPPDWGRRTALEARAQAEGGAGLYEELKRLDPDSAQRIDARNVRRVIRALEIFYSSPARTASQPVREIPPFSPVVLGLTLDRIALYERIDGRIDVMMQAGWVREVDGLLKRGYDPGLPSMSSLGYRELAEHIRGETTIDDALSSVKRRSRRLVRQQSTWFGSDDNRISWHQGTEAGLKAAVSEAASQLRRVGA